ncbi:hypothetical protein GCM10009092_25390 [Bowmanella denitrificans]|uniref:FlgO domain-containing protein n=2 Tax=Bowmanella denitrificans TaxID=366582 RepID=A0ABN0XBI8_9ALTE
MKVTAFFLCLFLTSIVLATESPETSNEHWASQGQRYVPEHHYKRLADYVEQMVLSMDDNALSQSNEGIVVASFVDLDESLTHTSMLGNQLAEQFMQQLRKQGYSVTESKATGRVTITERGDIVYSRDNRTLRQGEYCCVLSGTLVYSPVGIEVNSRLFDLQSQAVLASASTVIPYFVVSHLGRLE